MGVLSWIFSKTVFGGIGKILGGLGDYRNTKSMIEAGVLTEVIRSDIELNHIKVQMAEVNKDWWVTRFIVPGFAYPVMAHWIAVILDSIFHFGWKISALPSPLDDWEGQIILSFFIVGTAERLAGKWMNRGIVSSVIDNAKKIFSKRESSR